MHINDENIGIFKMSKGQGVNIQKADIPFVKVLISDSKEMMHTYTKFSQDKHNVIPETCTESKTDMFMLRKLGGMI